MHGNTITLRTTIARVLAAAALALAPAAWAQQRTFDIPATDAASALPEYARQAGVQIVAPGEQLAGVRTPAVRGSMDAHAALRMLLVGTGLKIADDDGRTITLTSDTPPPAAPASTPGSTPVQAPTSTPAPAATTPASPPPVAAADGSDQQVQNLGNVTVTGSFIRRIDAETSLPLTTLDQSDIALSGAMTVSDMLAQLPQSAGFDNSETSTGPNDARGDAASINLRGIGSGNTLVLLNGRRIAPHPIAAGAVPRLSANINQIPLGAIDRIEVLRDGASALYGSDAVAGVVNTVLKKDYEGAEANLRYGHVADGGMGETSATFLAGHNFNQGRTNIMGFVGYYDRTALDATDRSFTQTADLRGRAHSDDTRWDNRSLSGPWGNFISGTAQPDGYFAWRTMPGMDEPGFHTAPGTNGAKVESGSLPRDLRYDFTPLYVLMPKTKRYQVYTAFNHRFDNGVEAFGDFFYYHAKSFIANATSPISANSDNDIYVPASNYYNPFGTRFYGPGTAHPDVAPADVQIKNYRPADLGLRTANVTSRAYQVLGGLRGDIGSWNWEVGGEYGEGKTTDIGGNMISESRLRHQLALDTPDAFNPFGGPGTNSQEALDAIRIDTWRTGTSGLGIVDAKATGDLFEIGGGSVQAAVGLEYRHETFSDRRDALSNGDDVIAQSKSADSKGSRNVKSAFVEFSVPIVSESNAIPGIQRLELSLAGRSEHYSDFGTATKPKVGLAWSPVSWLLLRGSYSEGFRAPTLAQVFVGEITRRNTGTPDPYRADVVGSPADLGDESRQVIRGGNPDLGPEQAREHSFGFVLQPPFIERLSISVDWFQIRQRDVIDTYGEADQLDLDYQLRTSGQGSNADVVRLPVTAADEAAFAAWNAAHPDDQRTPVGAVDYVRDTYINISQRKVSGVDFGLNYKLPDTAFGSFNFKSDVAYLDTFEEQRDAESPKMQQLEINGLPRVRGVAGVSWKHRRYDAGLRANYIGHFKDTSAPTYEDGSYFDVKSWTTFNAYFGVKLGGDPKKGSYLRFGVNNLLDKDPPLADEDRGYFENVHDPRGRFLYAEWRVTM
jgi:outer membrane receptor protein involved in Fe transport